MVTALPGQVTRIKATFDKPGRYVWHCHILSHEDHEMMRVLNVGPEISAPNAPKAMAKTKAGTISTAAPLTFALDQNFPNPFNPSTQIRFQLPNAERVQLKVYDWLGRAVRTLVNGVSFDSGMHQVTWDGKNNRGQMVSSGIYICRIKAGRFSKSIKMNLVR
jgi:hypothetical protein